MIEAEVFLSIKIIYNVRQFQDCRRRIEDFDYVNALQMSLFDLMDNHINASHKYRVDKEELVKEKDRMKERQAVEDRIPRDRSTNFKSEEVGERNKADWIALGLEEVLAKLSMARQGEANSRDEDEVQEE